MNEDFIFLKLNCKDCENQSCMIYPNGYYLRGKEGCTRKVTQEEKDRFTHYMNEVLPFVRTYKNKEVAHNTIVEIEEYLDYIYTRPLGNKLDKYGKIKIKSL